jgi:hypothetical protein
MSTIVRGIVLERVSDADAFFVKELALNNQSTVTVPTFTQTDDITQFTGTVDRLDIDVNPTGPNAPTIIQQLLTRQWGQTTSVN